MAERLGALLDDERRRGFVGRRRELDAFAAALRGASSHRVLFVHGPGGIGKTTLLDRFRLLAVDAGRPVAQLHGRDQEIGPDTLLDATTGPGDGGVVVLVDGYERLGPLDGWIRDTWLPGLATDAVVALAGRDAPAPVWRTDPGWRALVSVHALDRLGGHEAAELLTRAGVDEALVDRLVELGAGHPLALGLLADAAAQGRVPTTLADLPDLVAELLPVVTDEAPDEAHAVGLELCAHVWSLTEGLLREAVGDRTPTVWRWLASRPFISHGPGGLYTHDLVREVLEAEYAHRAPEDQPWLHQLIRRHAWRHLKDASGAEVLRAATQLLWLHRKAMPIGGAYASVLEQESVTVAPGRISDHDDVVRTVRAWEGDGEARLAGEWMAACPDALRVMRRGDELVAFTVALACPVEPVLESDDPVVTAVLGHVARLGPLRPGERVSVLRFGGGTDRYQHDPELAVLGGISLIAEWLSRPFAWAWSLTLAPEVFDGVFAYMGFEHRLELDGARVAYGLDWRRIGFDRWYSIAVERTITGEVGPIDRRLLRPPPLDRSAFDTAVKAALRALHHPDELAAGALMGTEVAATDAGPDVERLQDRVRQAVARLGLDPTADELARVLDRTFVHPAASQEAAAEALGLPFSTYRRRLARATERVTDLLWAVELGELRFDDP